MPLSPNPGSLIIMANPFTDPVLQYIAGVIDGDGCIILNHLAAVRVSISQSQSSGPPPMLVFVQRYFGKAVAPINITIPNRRRQWILQFHGARATVILRLLLPHFIIKQRQALLALRCIGEASPEQKQVYVQQLREAKTLTNLNTVTVQPTRLTAAYLAGLWDAEGYVGLTGRAVRLSLAQLSSISMLQAVQHHLQLTGCHSWISHGVLYLNGASVFVFLKALRPYLVQKADQAQLLLDNEHLWASRYRGRTDIHALRDAVDTQLRAMKRS